jgi:hypothetical protein
MKILLTAVFSTICTLTVLAQNASPVTQITPTSTAATSPAKSIGPAPANTQQGKIIDGALSPQTRQTLQEAMNSSK